MRTYKYKRSRSKIYFEPKCMKSQYYTEIITNIIVFLYAVLSLFYLLYFIY